MKVPAFLIAILILASCRIPLPVTVELEIAEEHPFEDMARRDMWYTLVYFDGEAVRSEHVESGRRKVSVRVDSGGLRPFAMIPLGTLGPIGGFYEGDGHVMLRAEDGSFAEMLIRAAGYRPDAVSRLSVEALREVQPHLADIDEPAFLEDLYDGTLSPSSIESAESRSLMFDLIPSGYWLSERYDIPSFEVGFSGQTIYLDLRPGVYRFACQARSMLLTIAVDEEWQTSVSASQLPQWY